MALEMTFGKQKIRIPDISDKDRWKVIRDESYRPERDKFVFEKFIKDFPDFKNKIQQPSKVYSLCSRSAVLNEWLAKTNLEYASTESIPTYFRNSVSTSDWKQVEASLSEYKKIQVEKAKEELEAAKDYRNRLDQIAKEAAQKQSAVSATKYSTIINLNSTDLPLTLQLAIDNYSPAANTQAPTQKTFAREILVEYKLALIDIVKNDSNVDIDKVIEENKTK